MPTVITATLGTSAKKEVASRGGETRIPVKFKHASKFTEGYVSFAPAYTRLRAIP
jgi:hypothetical protein